MTQHALEITRLLIAFGLGFCAYRIITAAIVWWIGR